MNEHKDIIECMCRLCGQNIKKKKSYPVLSCQEEIKELFCIDVSEDIHDLHPTKLCNNCRMKCIHYRISRSKGKSYTVKIPDVFIYKPHSRDGNCEMCSKRSGRPGKRVKFNRLTFDFTAKKSKPDDSAQSGHSTSDTETASENESSIPTYDTACDRPDHGEIQSTQDFSLPGPRSKSSVQSTQDFNLPGPSSTSSVQSTQDFNLPGPSFTFSVQSTQDFILPGPSSMSSVMKTLPFETEDSMTSDFLNTELTSVEIERIVEKSLAEILQCSICNGLPTSPVITSCSHLFCKSCISAWLRKANVCPVCKVLTMSDDIDILRGQFSVLYDTLHVTCMYQDQGCCEVLNIKSHIEHENTCKFAPSKLHTPSVVRRGSSLVKTPISDCNRKYLKQKRLKPAINFIDDFCKSHNEDKGEVLYFMLDQHLLDKNDNRRHGIEALWHGYTTKLTPHQCLALRIDTLQSKAQYKAQYNFFKSYANNPLQPPSAVSAVEASYMPSSARYSLEGFEFSDNYYHTPAKAFRSVEYDVSDSFMSCEPINILSSFNVNVPEIATPNVKGVRWHYMDAVAKTLQELEPQIITGLQAHNLDPYDPSLILITSIKDGADGLGDVSVHKEISDRFLPDKAFRFSFCVLKIEVSLSNDDYSVVFQEEKPNSVRTNRPLLEAICDENNHASTCVCLLPIERERTFMKDKVMRVQIENGWRRHCLKFYNSMIDEKLDRAESGLAGSGSRYMCTLCEATRETAKSALGTFTIS